jgi:hypothetical protein
VAQSIPFDAESSTSSGADNDSTQLLKAAEFDLRQLAGIYPNEMASGIAEGHVFALRHYLTALAGQRRADRSADGDGSSQVQGKGRSSL